MTLSEIMVDFLAGKATTDETAAKMYEAFYGKPCPAESVNNAKKNNDG